MPNKVTKVDLEECRKALATGERWPSGICYNPDRYPEEFYPCTDQDQAVAEGKISVSWDGTKVTDLKTGQVTTQESNVVRRANPNFAPVSTTNADTKTTEGAHP
jgi:hypothetical protein